MYYKPFLGAVNTGRSIDRYILLFDGEWWICQKGGRQLVFKGEGYRKICETDFIGHEGQWVLGIFQIKSTRNLLPYRYEFIFVSNDLMAGYVLKNILPVKLHFDFDS